MENEMTKSEREQYISELQVVDGMVAVSCSLIGCYGSDLMPKDEAINMIESTWPYNDYICEHCYNNSKS